MANVIKYTASSSPSIHPAVCCLKVSAPTVPEAFSALLDVLAKTPGDFEIVGPYGTRVPGHAGSGYGYTAKLAAEAA